jgi:hypothetical protein
VIRKITTLVELTGLQTSATLYMLNPANQTKLEAATILQNYLGEPVLCQCTSSQTAFFARATPALPKRAL